MVGSERPRAKKARAKLMSFAEPDINEQPEQHGPGSLGRMVRNSSINAVGTVVNLALNFAAVFILARRLGKEALGLYFAIFTVALVVYFILESGITTMLTRRIAVAPQHLKRHVAEATGLLAVAAAGAVLLMGLMGLGWAQWDSLAGKTQAVGGLSHASLAMIFVVGGLACAGRLMLEFYAAVFRGLERFEYENIARAIQAALFAVLVIVAVHPPESVALYRAVWILVLSNLVAGVYIAVALQRSCHCLGFTLNRRVLADWLPESLPLGVGDLVQRLTWQVDTVMLSWLRPLADVGVYSIAYRPLQPLNLVPRTVLSVTFPEFSRLAETSREALGRAFARSIRLLWIVSLPISVVVCVCAEPLVVIPAGAEYRDAATPLRFLIWIVNLSFISTQFRFLFTALGRQRTFTRLVVPILILKIVVEIVLVHFWGYYGACAGSFLADMTLVVAGLAVCRRLGLGGLEVGLMLRAILPAALLALVLWTVSGAPWPVLLIVAALSTFGYFALCVVIGAVPRAELARLTEVVRSMAAARRARNTPQEPLSLRPATSSVESERAG